MASPWCGEDKSFLKPGRGPGFSKDLARFLCDYSSDDLRVQSSGDMSGSFLQ